MEIQESGKHTIKKVELINIIHKKYPQLRLRLYTSQLWRCTIEELKQIYNGNASVFYERIEQIEKDTKKKIYRKAMEYDTLDKKIRNYEKQIRKKTIKEVITLINKNRKITIKELKEKLKGELKDV